MHFALIFILGLVVLYPTFDLALTGDDYLGYWRLTKTIGEIPSFLQLLKYLFTDYGPMDILTYTIHHFLDFNHFYYYLLAFLLRFVASISFYPIVTKLTKSRLSSFIAASFFMISSTGMEVLDWSFNMPSYIGITFMNFSLYCLASFQKTNRITYLSYSLVFFLLSIISQPIRMLIIVPIIGLLHVYFFTFNSVNRIKYILSLLIYFLAFFILFTKANYFAVGDVTKSQRTESDPVKSIVSIFDKIASETNNSRGQILLTPLTQIGSIVLPLTEFSSNVNLLKQSEVSRISFLIFVTLLLWLIAISKRIKLSGNYIFTFSILYIIYFMFIAKTLLPLTGIKFHNSTFFGYFIGGAFILLSLILLFSKLALNLKLAVVISVLMIVFSFLPSWIRTPLGVETTRSRYLIVSSTGLAIFIATFINIFKTSKLLIFSVLIIFLINIFSTSKYVRHLNASRNIYLANRLRNSLDYYPQVGNSDKPFVYYFDIDNQDIFYHCLYFGFPFFLNYYKGQLQNPWIIMYTTNWDDTKDAFLTGSSIKKYMTIPPQTVKLENIFTYKVENGVLTNTSNQMRKRLMEIKDLESKNIIRN